MRSAVPQKLRSGNAARKSVMNALMSSRPRRGSCKEYLSSMSGAAISSMTARLTFLPQNSVNQRPTTALLSASLLIGMPPHHRLREDHRQRSMICAKNYDFGGRAELRFWPWNRKRDRGGDDHDRATRAPPAEIKPAFGVWPTADIENDGALAKSFRCLLPDPRQFGYPKMRPSLAGIEWHSTD